MRVVGSIIARLGSKRLAYKNLMPFEGKPHWGLGIEKLREAKRVDEIVVSTECELIARVALDFGASLLARPVGLASDDVPSIPVFQHLVRDYPCAVHLNFNINFRLCDSAVIDQVVELTASNGESLSRPYSAWAQTRACPENNGDPVSKYAHNHEFEDARAGKTDIHALENLLGTYRLKQSERPAELLDWIHPQMAQGKHSGSR